MQGGRCYGGQLPAGGGGGPITLVGGGGGAAELKRMVEENAAVVFAQRGCCMSFVVRRLLQAVGANLAVYEVEERDAENLAGELAAAGGGVLLRLPAVFIGGQWFGGPERVIATHITEELSPLLKQAGALWL